MTTMRAALAFCLLVPALAGLPAEALAKAGAAEPVPQKPPTDTYVYQPAGRRDPFTTLLATGVEPRRTTPNRRPEGLAGIMVDEIAVKGVLQSGKTMMAMIAGPDGKHHIIRTGDKFMDGFVKTIIPQGLIIVQDVSDPLSLEKHREVRKLLKSKEDKQ
jgi:type IV pilus assembly protein PilP